MRMSAADQNTKNVPLEVTCISERIHKEFVPDNRIALFDVDFQKINQQILVKGVTTSSQAKPALLSALRQMKYEVRDSLQLLPDSIALEGRTLGVVNVSVCNLRVAPDYSSSRRLTTGIHWTTY